MYRMKENDSTKTVECQDCKKSIPKSRYWTHLRDHNREDCNICGKNIAKSHLKSHLENHDNKHKSQVKCKHCEKFFSKSFIKEHIYNHENIEKKTKRCEICGSDVGIYSISHHMIRHKESITVDVKQECPTCGKLYDNIVCTCRTCSFISSSSCLA